MIVRNNEDIKFTVSVGLASGGFFNLKDAKNEARRLARLNDPKSVLIEGVDGLLRWIFYVEDKKMIMTYVRYERQVVKIT